MQPRFDTWDAVTAALLEAGWSPSGTDVRVYFRGPAKARIRNAPVGGYVVSYSQKKRR